MSHLKSEKRPKNVFVVTRATFSRLHEPGHSSKPPPRSPIDLYFDKLALRFGFCLIQARSGAGAEVGNWSSKLVIKTASNSEPGNQKKSLAAAKLSELVFIVLHSTH